MKSVVLICLMIVAGGINAGPITSGMQVQDLQHYLEKVMARADNTVEVTIDQIKMNEGLLERILVQLKEIAFQIDPSGEGIDLKISMTKISATAQHYKFEADIFGIPISSEGTAGAEMNEIKITITGITFTIGDCFQLTGFKSLVGNVNYVQVALNGESDKTNEDLNTVINKNKDDIDWMQWADTFMVIFNKAACNKNS